MTEDMTDGELADALDGLAEHGRPLLAHATCSVLRVAADRLRRPQPPLLLKVAEAARLASVSRTAAYNLIASGAWPVLRIGRSVRVRYDALVDWANRS
jgi:excisionase family DNA binding protein